MFINKDGIEFTFGQDDFGGAGLTWNEERLTQGIIVNGGTGSGKTNRVFLPLSATLLKLRLRQDEKSRWGGLFIDPKLSYASRLIELINRAGLKDELCILSENQSITINPLLSGLNGQKIAEFIVRSLLAGRPVSSSAGAAYYESRALALFGYIITIALFSSRPCLRLVGDMVDALTEGGAVTCAHPQATEALRRIQIFMRGEEKERKMVLDSIQNYLEPFRCDPWRAIFFEYGPFHLDDIRERGKMIIAAFSPNKVHNLSSGLFLLKMLFYATVMDRQTIGFTGNKERLCLYFIDEFQQVASGSSDADFLAVRREARACPVFAFQQITQIETVLPNEWRNVLGLLTTKIFLRLSDVDTAAYAEKCCGLIETPVDAVTTTPDSLNLFYAESSRTTTRQLHPRIPADYFQTLPDGDAVIVNDKRRIAWFPAYGMTQEEEVAWRQKRWPDRPRLLHPRDFRSE